VVMFIDHEYRPADLLKRADKVMYQAKESGRNQVRFLDL
jgi:PleD family two-component response regulator